MGRIKMLIKNDVEKAPTKPANEVDQASRRYTFEDKILRRRSK